MKAYGFKISSKAIGYNFCIRNKIGIIKLLVEIMRFLFITRPVALSTGCPQLEEGTIYLIIYIDKMSRIFISEENKIHSFFFPFTLREDENRYSVYFNDWELSSGSCSILSAAFRDICDSQPLETILEQYWDTVGDFNLLPNEVQLHSSLITYLLTFEPGYLRFDHDFVQALPGIHPLDHIDFNYTNKIEFKVGVESRLDHQQLINILDLNRPCFSLKSL